MTDTGQSTQEDDKDDKEAARENKTEYYVLKALLEAADNVAGKMDDFNRKYFQETLADGRAFVEEARVDQRRAFQNLVDGGKEFVSDKKNAGRETVSRWVDGGKQFLSDAVKSPRETMGELADDVGKLAGDARKGARETMTELAEKGREIASGVKSDSSVLVDDLLQTGKKIMGDAPSGENIGDKVGGGLGELSKRMNLPSKKDIRNLTDALKDLSDKIDALDGDDEKSE
ncbi:MAG: hypothetical protein GY859_08285 [Desulfobacterales bacterium]|nr:hypothetical protein [Desulfobacterales bacterium]